MQSLKNTSNSNHNSYFGFLIKLGIVLIIIITTVAMLSKIDFPTPNKEIKKTIPNEKLKIVK
tara:strand:+ start:190 stop:375 length:186 start_codon:yes stop_codon:yes gene_type:complete